MSSKTTYKVQECSLFSENLRLLHFQEFDKFLPIQEIGTRLVEVPMGILLGQLTMQQNHSPAGAQAGQTNLLKNGNFP